MQQGVTFFVEDLEAVLEMNRLLEKENEELKQEVNHLRNQIMALRVHDLEKKPAPCKRADYSIEGTEKGMRSQATANGRIPEESAVKETQAKRSDQAKGRVEIPQPPQKPGKQNFEQKAQPCPPPPTTATAAPPPPPPLPSKAMAGSRAVCRVPEVIEFYRFLNNGNARIENRTGATGALSEANSKNMIGEIENRSTYLSAVKSDVETQAEFINFLTREVQSAAFTDISSVEAFVKWLDGELSCLVDERAVLKHFPLWPERKADAMREASCCYRDMKNLESEVSSFKDNPKHTSSQILRRIQALQDRRICHRYLQIKLGSLRLANLYMKRIARELQSSRCSNTDDLTVQGVRFAYRIHQ
ncbi:INCREASED PETAL GROWTH ANISOTROPY 1-like protein, partial [Drosera capensis]